MSIRFSVKRLATVTISKTNGGDVSGYVLRQATTRLITAFRQTEASNQLEINYLQSMRDRHNEQGSTNITNGDKSTTSYVSDKAKEGVKKATDAALNAGDNMKDAIGWRLESGEGNGSKHQRSNSGG
ncbi:hypothetical protein IGI04_003582 [Brassica rapa subsp. trilocularis]|uniref:Uncharacterized protein n=1 Tax=Brassica rapa subsp. trilocularis TaxID=1813537 RepID=A0ABQ7KII1_BRACM|nr:hypothetical protein IGI04_043018 [Brassica rapa subsp. trilocularis]KAG5416015.1 hypothetical protein IGI04_003582 [Brassica rapa subsp. trilocularis]